MEVSHHHSNESPSSDAEKELKTSLVEELVARLGTDRLADRGVYLSLATDLASDERDPERSARKAVNLFRAAHALLLASDQSLLKIMDDFEAFSPTLFERGNFHSWTSMMLDRFSKEDLSEIEDFTRQLSAK